MEYREKITEASKIEANIVGMNGAVTALDIIDAHIKDHGMDGFLQFLHKERNSLKEGIDKKQQLLKEMFAELGLSYDPKNNP